jgi:hypothetical protein
MNELAACARAIFVCLKTLPDICCKPRKNDLIDHSSSSYRTPLATEWYESRFNDCAIRTLGFELR